MLRVFVSGPLTQPPGKQAKNVERAMRVGVELIKMGHAPIIPHLFHFVELHTFALSIGYEDWMAVDFKLLEGCDIVLRMPGHSPGGDREVEHANAHGIPVVYSLDHIPCASSPA